MKRPVPGIMEGNKIRPVLLRDITTEEEARIDLKDDELNRVLGGGLVKGSLVLIGESRESENLPWSCKPCWA